MSLNLKHEMLPGRDLLMSEFADEVPRMGTGMIPGVGAGIGTEMGTRMRTGMGTGM